MCGIAGMMRFDGKTVSPEDLNWILDRMRHRGSDSSGIIIGSSKNRGHGSFPARAEIGLAHRRLSIIDLSDAARQPMSYADGRLWITYNGEIYNYVELRKDLEKNGYVFSSHSDTEVILASYMHWGSSCVKRFNGMFAFAIWDNKRDSLFCARDPLGIKPFYYLHNAELFAFASESSALAPMVANSLDMHSVASYLLCMYVPGPWSIFEGIHKLKPGYTMTITPDGHAGHDRFWNIDRYGARGADRVSSGEIETLIKNSVERQLRSDVPVGALLSGGIDSSIVVAMAAEKGRTLHTFSAGYEGHHIDELPYARQIAERYGTRHHELRLTRKGLISNLDKALRAMNEPISDSAMVPTFMLCEMAAGEGVKVLLNGTGGDEAFGGYDRYTVGNAKRLLLEALPYGARSFMGRLPVLMNSMTGSRLRSPGLDLIVRTGGSVKLARELFATDAEFFSFLDRLDSECFPGFSALIPRLYNQMVFDVKTYLPDELLLLLDQMTMAWTLEGRVPLLDIDLVRAAYSVPPECHVRGRSTKMLLREVARPLIGDRLASREKCGFGGPVPFWVENNAEEMAEALAGLRHIGLFENIDLRQKRSRGARLSVDDTFELFNLYCFSRWYERLKGF